VRVFWGVMASLLGGAGGAYDAGVRRTDGGAAPAAADAELARDVEFFQNLDAAADLDLLQELSKSEAEF